MKKTLMITLSASLMMGALAACSGQQNPGAGSATQGKAAETDSKKEKLTITMMAGSFKGGAWADNNVPTIQYLNQKFNIDLQVQWVPGPNYSEKLNVLAASGNLPDMFYIYPNEYLKWQSQGVFKDLKPLLKDYPHLAKEFTDELWQAYNPKGKIFGFPKFQPKTQNSFVIREDWLKKLNLPIPKPDTFTLDEFYNIAKAFAKNDPDGNGKNDTVGFSIAPDKVFASDLNFFYAEPLEAAFGLADGWKVENNKLIPKSVQKEELKQFMTFLRKAYAEGVLDKDFPLSTGDKLKEDMAANKLGIGVMHFSLRERTVEDARKVAKDASIVQVAPPKGPTGLRGNPISYAGTEKIVLNSKLDEKKTRRIMEMFDWWVTPEGTDIIKNGPEGAFYEVKDGKKVPTALGMKEGKRTWILNNWFFRNSSLNYDANSWDPPEYAEGLAAAIKFNEPYARPVNAALNYAYQSPTYTKKWAELNTKLMESLMKVIVGKEPLESVDAAVEKWKADGGNQIIEEVNKAYQADK